MPNRKPQPWNDLPPAPCGCGPVTSLEPYQSEGQFYGPRDSTLFCLACGTGWVANDAELEQALVAEVWKRAWESSGKSERAFLRSQRRRDKSDRDAWKARDEKAEAHLRAVDAERNEAAFRLEGLLSAVRASGVTVEAREDGTGYAVTNQRAVEAEAAIAQAWSRLTGWDARRLFEHKSHAAADAPLAALVDAADRKRVELDEARKQLADAKAREAKLREALVEHVVWIERSFSTTSHWHECDQHTDDPEDPPNGECTCQFGQCLKLHAALAVAPDSVQAKAAIEVPSGSVFVDPRFDVRAEISPPTPKPPFAWERPSSPSIDLSTISARVDELGRLLQARAHLIAQAAFPELMEAVERLREAVQGRGVEVRS